MASTTEIEWTDATWNPVTGCTKISAGCDFCYAERFAERFRGVPNHPFTHGFDLTLRPERVEQPLSWRQPKMIFVNSMSDLFHKGVPTAFVDRVFDTIERAEWHTFQLLTKRSSRLRDYMNTRYAKRTPPRHLWVGASVEGELGVLGSLETGEGEAEDGHGATGKLSHDQLLTDPDQAVDFVARTGVDALAIACGTSHGAYKFSRKPDGDILAMGVIEKIHAKLPNTHLVMHGSSSVPQELQDIINAHGGEMPQTFGVPVEEIVRGIAHGVRKVNIDTDCRMAMTGQFRKIAKENPAEFDPRKFLKPAMDAMRDLCRDRFEAFGAAGNASRIKVVAMDEMAKRYAAGKLDPQIAPAKAA